MGLMLICTGLSAQVSTDSLTIYFKVNHYDYDPSFRGNGQRMDEFVQKVRNVQSLPDFTNILVVNLESSSSPEGSFEFNESLALKRFDSIEKYLRSRLDFADSTVVESHALEDWDGLVRILRDSDYDWKDEALQLISEEADLDQREAKLRVLRGGQPWNQMLQEIFPDLRKFTIIIRCGMIVPILEEEEDIVPEQLFQEELVLLDTQVEAPAVAYKPKRISKLKTNLVGLGMGHANLAYEFPVAKHWSISLPFYYSGGFDYFKSTIKFRGIVFQPELRYYLRDNDGFYAGAHFGLGWYNFALDGEWRIQDHMGKTPSIGAGIGCGYSLQFPSNPRWGMEFAVGAGVYHSKYDVFYNEPNGPYHRVGVERTWFGIDNAAISFTYNFGAAKKGGKK